MSSRGPFRGSVWFSTSGITAPWGLSRNATCWLWVPKSNPGEAESCSEGSSGGAEGAAGVRHIALAMEGGHKSHLAATKPAAFLLNSFSLPSFSCFFAPNLVEPTGRGGNFKTGRF